MCERNISKIIEHIRKTYQFKLIKLKIENKLDQLCTCIIIDSDLNDK